MSASEKLAGQQAHDSNEWEGMGRAEIFKAGMEAERTHGSHDNVRSLMIYVGKAVYRAATGDEEAPVGPIAEMVDDILANPPTEGSDDF